MHIEFPGTGASGGTPGDGRSHRRESAAVVEAGPRLLLDVPRHVATRADLAPLDAVLVTHAHRDAAGA